MSNAAERILFSTLLGAAGGLVGAGVGGAVSSSVSRVAASRSITSAALVEGPASTESIIGLTPQEMNPFVVTPRAFATAANDAIPLTAVTDETAAAVTHATTPPPRVPASIVTSDARRQAMLDFTRARNDGAADPLNLNRLFNRFGTERTQRLWFANAADLRLTAPL